MSRPALRQLCWRVACSPHANPQHLPVALSPLPLAFAVICIVHTSSTCTPPPRVHEPLNAPGSPRQRPSTPPPRGRRAPPRAPEGAITRNVTKARRHGHPDEAGVTRVRAPSRAPRTGWESLSSALRTWPRSRDPRDCPHASPSASPHPRSRPRASERPPDEESNPTQSAAVIKGHGQANAHLARQPEAISGNQRPSVVISAY